MSNAYKYEFLSQSEKNCIDMVDMKDMLTLLKDGDEVLFYRIHSILAEKVKDGHPLNEDQQSVLTLPYLLFGSMAGYELYKMKKQWDVMKSVPKEERQGYKYAKRKTDDPPF